jgi:hypothetical protein
MRPTIPTTSMIKPAADAAPETIAELGFARRRVTKTTRNTTPEIVRTVATGFVMMTPFLVS